MPNPCYSYPADVPPGSGNDDAMRAVRRDLREMPYPCYSYPDDAPWAVTGRDAVPAPPGLRQMPFGSCFRY